MFSASSPNYSTIIYRFLLDFVKYIAIDFRRFENGLFNILSVDKSSAFDYNSI